MKKIINKINFEKIINWLFNNRHDTRILKTMDEYKIGFDLDDKIAQNRHRLREQFEQYKKIENYYPLFLAYIGSIGIYYFDFITYFSSTNPIFTLITVIVGLIVLFSCYLMGQIFFTKKWKNDYLPIDVYSEYYNNIKKDNPTETDSVIEQKTKEGYLHQLELWNESNFKSYNDKKRKIPQLINVIIISLFLYSINIGMYKYIKMEYEKNKTEKPLALCEYLIKTYSNEGDMVLDNTAGSGTTLLGAKNLNRLFIGIEKEEKYFEVIKNRLL